MIDSEGFRPNVGIIVANDRRQVLWTKRIRQDAWQFPQGGIHEGETAEQALFRELNEEVGLSPTDVEILACTKGWLRYRLPRRLRRSRRSNFVGQKQKWFLLQMLADDSAIRFDATDDPEFDHWAWVSYWYPLGQVVDFKRGVYRRAMRELVSSLARPVEVSSGET